MKTDLELMQQALHALELIDEAMPFPVAKLTIKNLRERLAQPNEFNPDWDAMAVMVEQQQRMATEIDNLKRRLKSVNTAAMRLTSDLTCMEVDDDERLDRDRVMGRVMQWRNEWDKAMHNNQPQMQPCAGRNCGSTNPNLHSAECFEDYEKATGMSSVEHAVIAGALFDFMGWLTSRKERIVLSSADNASPAVEVITEFAKMRSLSLDDARVTDWQDIARKKDAA